MTALAAAAVVTLHAQSGREGAKLDADAQRWTAATLAKMTLDDKVGQLLVSSFGSEYLSTDSAEYDALARAVHEYRVGGFHVCGCLQHRRARQIELGAGELRTAGECLGTVEFPAGIVQRRLEAGPFGTRLGDARLGFDEPGLKGRGIEPSEHLAGFDA